MKTKLFFLSTIFTTLLSAQTFIVNDTFETDVLGSLPAAWIIRYNGSGNANQIIVDNPVQNGTKSFQMEGVGGWSSTIYKIPSNIPNLVTLEAWVMPEKILSDYVGSIGLGDLDTDTWGTYTSRLGFINGKIVATHHPGGTNYIIQDYLPNTWYHIKMQHNLAANTYKVYINGVLSSGNDGSGATNVFPMNSTVSKHLILLAGNAGTTKMFWDDVKLYETKEPVAYYPFNGNANDESGNLNHGNVSGATLTTDRFGNANSAYEFDGNDIITIAHNSSLNFENELSFSVWAKPINLQNAMILGKSNYVSNTNYLLRTKSSGFIEFEYKDFANSTNNPLIANQWNHIAVVSNGTNEKKVYINNVLTAHTTSSSPFGLVNNVLTIGGASYSAEYFIGSIDDLRIYNSALSSSEILSLYTNNSLKVEKVETTTENNFYVSENTLQFKNTQNLNEIKTIKVYNLLGQKIFETSKIENKISLKQIKQGVYIIKVENENGTFQTLKCLMP